MLKSIIKKLENSNFGIYKAYFKYVMEHKKNVWKVCKSKKIYKHGLLHDMSKLTLSEFKPYALYFYKDKELYREQFETAWHTHYKKNPHHWEHWVGEDNVPVDIPILYIAEMIADWEAMSIKFGDTPQAYYMQNYYKFNLSYTTRLWAEYMLGINLSVVQNYGHTLEDFFMNMGTEWYKAWREKENEWLHEKYGVDLLNVFLKHNNN